MSHRYNDETVIDVFRSEKIKKEYRKRGYGYFLLLFGCALLFLLIPTEPSIAPENSIASVLEFDISTDVSEEFDEDKIEPLTSTPLGFVKFFGFVGFLLSSFLVFGKPIWFKIGEYQYEKTVMSNKREYDSIKKALKGKEDWKGRKK